MKWHVWRWSQLREPIAKKKNILNIFLCKKNPYLQNKKQTNLNIYITI